LSVCFPLGNEGEKNILDSEEINESENSATAVSAALSSINSLAVNPPKFKFTDLLEEQKFEAVTLTSLKAPDSFKFFAAVPGSSAS
jgi:hypothetical protein